MLVIGNVRWGAIKLVAASVGEGILVVVLISA
jgi:hypothetical protein